MLIPSFGLVLLASAGLVEGRSFHDIRHHYHAHHQVLKRQNVNSTTPTTPADPNALTLSPDAVQTGSLNDGTKEGGVLTPGQSKSQVSPNNFINFCAGKTLTNGLQLLGGSCNGVVMGDIPEKRKMVSTIITFPKHASSDVVELTDFDITINVINLLAGSFTEANKTYYSAPQELVNGVIKGHVHLTVQDLGADLNPPNAPDVTRFAFFKGINDNGDGQGNLKATVVGGLKAGAYRVCSMSSASNHQPCLMPVAQRGAQDDCQKFFVVPKNNNGGNGGNGGNGNASSASSSVVVVGTSASASSSAASNAATTGAGTTRGQTTRVRTTRVRTTRAATTRAATTKAATTKAATTKAATTKAATTKAATTKAATTKAATTKAATTKAVTTKAATTKAAAVTTRRRPGFGGFGKPPKTIIIRIVHKTIIIRTFFNFNQFSLGGLPPAVVKNGQNGFIVLQQTFISFSQACLAACSQQWTTCISISGPGFGITECETQRTACRGAAQVVAIPPPAATPSAVTATATVPPSVSVAGTVIAEETVSSAVEVVETPTPTPEVGAGRNSTSTLIVAPTATTASVEIPAQTETIAPTSTGILPNLAGKPGITGPGTGIAAQPTFSTISTSAESVATPSSVADAGAVKPPVLVKNPLFGNSTVSRIKRF